MEASFVLFWRLEASVFDLVDMFVCFIISGGVFDEGELGSCFYGKRLLPALLR
jgi:hypothetical protein